MKMYIYDRNVTLEVGIYNLNGDEATEMFMNKHFIDYPSAFRKLSEEEKKEYNTTADYGIDNECFNAIVGMIGNVQPIIDDIAKIKIENEWDYDRTIKFGNIDGENYLI